MTTPIADNDAGPLIEEAFVAGQGGSVERVGEHTWIGRNERGGEVRISSNDAEGTFSPGELLQLAVASCSTVTIEEMVTRRSGPDARVDATVTRDRAPGTYEFQRISVTLDVDVDGSDEALIRALRKAIERQCTISRTVEQGAVVDLEIVAGPGDARAS